MKSMVPPYATQNGDRARSWRSSFGQRERVHATWLRQVALSVPLSAEGSGYDGLLVPGVNDLDPMSIGQLREVLHMPGCSQSTSRFKHHNRRLLPVGN